MFYLTQNSYITTCVRLLDPFMPITSKPRHPFPKHRCLENYESMSSHMKTWLALLKLDFIRYITYHSLRLTAQFCKQTKNYSGTCDHQAVFIFPSLQYMYPMHQSQICNQLVISVISGWTSWLREYIRNHQHWQIPLAVWGDSCIIHHEPSPVVCFLDSLSIFKQKTSGILVCGLLVFSCRSPSLAAYVLSHMNSITASIQSLHGSFFLLNWNNFFINPRILKRGAIQIFALHTWGTPKALSVKRKRFFIPNNNLDRRL